MTDDETDRAERGINWEAERDMARDVAENHKLYAALAGACSCDECEGESWYVEDTGQSGGSTSQ